jgi:hypothetical protein
MARTCALTRLKESRFNLQLSRILSECRSAACNKLQNQNDYRQHKQYVDESAQRIRTHQSEQPQYKKNYKDCPKHTYHLLRPLFLVASTTDHWKQNPKAMVVRLKKKLRAD